MNFELDQASSSSSFSSNPINSVSMSSLGSSSHGGGAPLAPPKVLIPGKHLPEPTALIEMQTSVHGTPMDVVVPVLTTPVEMATTPATEAGTTEKQEEKVGRWSDSEHKVFLEGLERYGKQWKTIAVMIGTRTVVQVRTHAQKYFQKMERGRKNNSSKASNSAEESNVQHTVHHKSVSKRKSLTNVSVASSSSSSAPSRKKPRSPKKTTRVVSIASTVAPPPPPLAVGATSPTPPPLPPLELPHHYSYMSSNASSLENLSTISPTGVADMDLGMTLTSSYSTIATAPSFKGSNNSMVSMEVNVMDSTASTTTTTVGAPGAGAPAVGLDVNVDLGDDPLEWLIDGAGMHHLPESSLEHAPMFPDFSDMNMSTTGVDNKNHVTAVQVQPKSGFDASFLQDINIVDPKVTVQSLFLGDTQH